MPSKNKIVSLKEAISISNGWKNSGEKIVFTNGCFDIVHLGHIDYLEKASELGTKMILGINTDASVKNLKSITRPIISEESRYRLMAALEFVDLVIPFGDETPLKLISSLMPDVLVKGDDYTIETIVGSKEVLENGGKVKTVALVDGYSTSKIVEKILSQS